MPLDNGRQLADQTLSSVNGFTKDVSSGPDFAYKTHGLSSEQGHRIDVSGGVDIRRQTHKTLNRHLRATDDRASDIWFVRSGHCVWLSRSTHSLTNGVRNVR